jgi:hypothetical protein
MKTGAPGAHFNAAKAEMWSADCSKVSLRAVAGG